MYKIRNCQKKDYKEIEQLCIGTADEKMRNSSMFRTALLDVFCRYYLEEEPENCFVAADDEDEVKGYIVCAKDYDLYATVFQKKYLTASNPVTSVIGKASMEALKDFAAEYPSHLHINIHPECQGKGLGRRLIETLAEHLSRQGCKGIMLDVSIDNIGARSFYENCGFQILRTGEREILMGKKLYGQYKQII